MKTNKQFVYERNHISTMKRLRIKESRDLINGIRMNRNERVDDFEKIYFQRFLAKLNLITSQNILIIQIFIQN